MRPGESRGPFGRGRESFKHNEPEKHAINEQISAPTVRVVDSDGSQLGILPTKEAILKAEEQGLDLVEVAAGASPPVCRILDYGKLKYREQKKAAEARKRSSTQVVKVIRVRYSTDKHDLDTKIRQAKNFIEEGDKVRFEMRFKGREAVYQELGKAIFEQITQLMEDVAVVEERTPLLGQKMMLGLAPKGHAVKK